MDSLNVNCSLPRSGSELLQCLLMQHPQIYGSITSPLLGLWHGAHATAGQVEANGHGFEKTRDLRRAFIVGGTEAYYQQLTDKPIVVDKSRAWFDKLGLLWELWPQARVFCMLRPEEQIIESLEKRYQADPLHPDFTGIPLHPQKRFEYWMNRPPLQSALGGLEFMRKTYGDDPRIVYILYEALKTSTVEVMREVFERLGVEPIDVDTTNVVKQVEEMEGAFWPLGDHNVRKVIS